MTKQLLTIDETLDTAWEIFLEMAEDNLEDADLTAFRENEDDCGLIVLDPNEDWKKHLTMEIDFSQFYEVKIGFTDEESIIDVLVRMLISRDPENKDCHLLWKVK